MNDIPSIPTRALIQKEWKYNKKKILPMIIGLILFGFLTVGLLEILPEFASYLEGLLPEFTPAMSLQSFMSSVNSIVSIIAVILCADAIAGEREHNTLVLIQTKPIKPHSIILTKLFARYLIVLVATIFGAISVYFFTWIMMGKPDIISLLLSLLIYSISLFVYTSIGMIISTTAKSQISAGAISAGVILLITMVSSILNFEKFQPYNIFELSANVTLIQFSATTIGLSCLILFLIGTAITIGSILLFYSEKEPTRKRI